MTKASSPPVKIPRSRAPNGIDSLKRLRVSLLPHEREEIERRAFAQGRSVSSLARIYLLLGMQQDRRGTPVEAPATTPEATEGE